MHNLTAHFRMKRYLACSEYIDWKHPLVLAKAAELAEGCLSDELIAKRCFGFVRDAIKHSWDFRMNPVTCKASDVLQHGTGYCYAKAHLLAALLRANGIPAGLCYQRLTVETDGPPYCLHGLNAVYLQKHGWYRIDARGNKQGVNAGFTPPTEQLAFAIVDAHEQDLPGIYAQPLPIITDTLTRYSTFEEVYRNLPDKGVMPINKPSNSHQAIENK
ncbi:MAG: transglutaminase family protein [Methylococcales bacterium]|nr:transglutaminase family protein [Methylococcales bacterium]